jgi:diguanylate cyclase (GGDEF)-like protein/PAS domain S-box-containing protein
MFFGWLVNIPIRVKAFAASAVLLLCLTGLGATAYLTLDGSARGLTQLRESNLPKQIAVVGLMQDVTATHIMLLRHVTWGSNGVSQPLLQSLSAEISKNLATTRGRFQSFASQARLMPAEDQKWISLKAKWDKYDRATSDTLDVANTDAPMATMMLGATDDDFQQVARELQDLSALVTDRTRSVTEALADDAESRKWILAFGCVAGVIISIFVTLFVSGSIVSPIRSVTQAMSEISVGNMNIELDSRNRRDEIGQMIDAITIFRNRLNLQQVLLKQRNEQLDAAMNNVSHGIAMFNAEQRLLICNSRFITIYGLSQDAVKPGVTAREIFDRRSPTERRLILSSDEFENALLEGHTIGKTGLVYSELGDGRCIEVAVHPMPGRGTVTTHEDVTERRRAEAKILQMAHYDALTGLCNRVLLHERLDLALACNRDQGLTVFCLDLDRFKTVNDTLGHEKGDKLLKLAAKRLKNCVRENNTVARLGGDEFAIVDVALPSVEDACNLATHIIDELSCPYDLDGHHTVIGISIGIARAPNDGVESDQLMKNADLALYRAKAEGRNTFRFFESDMGSAMLERRSLEMDLRTALAKGEFELYYQPVRNLDREEISGVEALLRWNHPKRGRVSPAEFIPLAEETGLIVPIGEWVLRTACAEATSWPADIGVAVNLSAVQFKRGDLFQTVSTVLALSGLAPHRLELEVTESVLIQDGKAAIAILSQLRGLGVRIALDDFGTGYSSLGYLQRLPLDRIKLDRCFVKDLSNTLVSSRVILTTVAQLAKNLGLSTTAEGVETVEQLNMVREEGCTEVQGYFFSQPVPASEILRLLVKKRQSLIRAV